MKVSEVRLTLWLSSDLSGRLVQLAEADGRSRGDIVRRLIRAAPLPAEMGNARPGRKGPRSSGREVQQ